MQRDAGGLITLPAVRNPIRLKNLRLQFVPIAALALLAMCGSEPAAIGTRTFASGMAFIVGGVLLRSQAAGHLSKRERLTVSGPYSRMRHPLYIGTLGLAIGFACLIGGVLAWLLAAGTGAWFFLLYFPRKERHESALLEANFGAAYVGYRAAVPPLYPRRARWEPSHDVARSVALSHSWRWKNWVENNELGTLLGVAAACALIAARAWQSAT
jgi:protein-S-isoprenylcysteine O-methyltransferase Ste14